jgi:hypothetical protein
MVQSKPVTVTKFGWLAGATFLLAMSSVLTVVMAWGWWELRRTVTLSPVECAQVMPDVLAKKDMEAEEIIKLYGEVYAEQIPVRNHG